MRVRDNIALKIPFMVIEMARKKFGLQYKNFIGLVCIFSPTKGLGGNV